MAPNPLGALVPHHPPHTHPTVSFLQPDVYGAGPTPQRTRAAFAFPAAGNPPLLHAPAPSAASAEALTREGIAASNIFIPSTATAASSSLPVALLYIALRGDVLHPVYPPNSTLHAAPVCLRPCIRNPTLRLLSILCMPTHSLSSMQKPPRPPRPAPPVAFASPHPTPTLAPPPTRTVALYRPLPRRAPPILYVPLLLPPLLVLLHLLHMQAPLPFGRECSNVLPRPTPSATVPPLSPSLPRSPPPLNAPAPSPSSPRHPSASGLSRTRSPSPSTALPPRAVAPVSPPLSSLPAPLSGRSRYRSPSLASVLQSTAIAVSALAPLGGGSHDGPAASVAFTWHWHRRPPNLSPAHSFRHRLPRLAQLPQHVPQQRPRRGSAAPCCWRHMWHREDDDVAQRPWHKWVMGKRWARPRATAQG